MNATFLARDAYGASNSATRTQQSTEYDAFSRVTAAMKKAETFAETVEALTRNRRLWTILASDVASTGNGLPDTLKAEILSLADFTIKHTGKILRRAGEIEPLVEINTSVMAGLRQQGQRT